MNAGTTKVIKSVSPIAVLMSTYNGEKYIGEQIESIIGQRTPDWELFIRDDGSTDGTLSVISQYCSRDGRIHLLDDSTSHRGVKGSFLWLLAHVQADYYMFCDQDDFWLPSKIEISLAKMKEVEKGHPEKPCLVVTDLTVVDENLNTTDASMWKRLKINGIVDRPEFLAVAAIYTGCTMLFNNAAKDISLAGSDASGIIHDQVIALNVYKACGAIVPIKEPQILYRQHGNNAIGAKSNRSGHDFIKIIRNVYRESAGYYKTVKPILGISLPYFIIKKIQRLIK